MFDHGSRVRRARWSRDLSQEDLADAAGVTPRTIGRLERGEVTSERTRFKVARALGLPEHELFVIHDDENGATDGNGRGEPHQPGAAAAKRSAGLARTGG